jgi:hypothetical protein
LLSILPDKTIIKCGSILVSTVISILVFEYKSAWNAGMQVWAYNWGIIWRKIISNNFSWCTINSIRRCFWLKVQIFVYLLIVEHFDKTCLHLDQRMLMDPMISYNILDSASWVAQILQRKITSAWNEIYNLKIWKEQGMIPQAFLSYLLGL